MFGCRQVYFAYFCENRLHFFIKIILSNDVIIYFYEDSIKNNLFCESLMGKCQKHGPNQKKQKSQHRKLLEIPIYGILLIIFLTNNSLFT
ncbi:protein of unknown function [Pseudodesulfovibrio piezophilus C1TLV30]|uniref:Uncharacterized protein n=1 Tax=Pseudodesulfovibrio piezophilus (strain DSM 21447 / JCM 15486 / C1TLV30) TaxID=1322246 RepID=M1WJD6_PSEP2|nr:protein of unknown function [Pseudodesulfovibrio piezophilus C1TLV30]